MFELHTQLVADTLPVGQFRLSLLRLHKDATYPWLVLVPKRENMREIFHLSEDDQLQLMRESSHLSEVMTSIFAPTKMNIAAIGNIIPQLHIHHVARYDDDAAWPRSIWGVTEPNEYEPAKLEKTMQRLHSSLVGEGFEPHSVVSQDSASSAGFTP